jgi:transcriptional regulator with XRE-family HTH domain
MTTKKHYGLKEMEKEYGPLTFGKALGAHRLSEEMSQKDFAKRLGMTPQSLCDLEKGRKLPSADRAARIAEKLKEPAITWVSLALEDQLREAHLAFKVELHKVG